MRALFAVATTALLALPAAAQDMHDPDNAVAGAALPEGWSARPDRGSMDNINFRTMAPGWHVTLGPAAIFWRATDRAEGSYSITANLSQTRAPAHPEAYGIFIGGNNLNADTQSYLYFLVRGDGKFLVKSRTGGQTATLSEGGWTEHAAVRAANAQGQQTNVLRVTVANGNVQFRVNDQVVWSGAQAAARTNGVYGLRVNHNLDVHVQELSKS